MRKIISTVLAITIIAAVIVIAVNTISLFSFAPTKDISTAVSKSAPNSSVPGSSAAAFSAVSSSQATSSADVAAHISSAAASLSGAPVQKAEGARATSSAAIRTPVPTVKVDDTPPPAPKAQSQPTVPESFWGDTGMPGISKVFEYGKTLLTADEQSVYDQIAAGVLDVKADISINTDVGTTGVKRIWQYYLDDHPETFYVTGVKLLYNPNGSGGQNTYTLQPIYSYNGNTVDISEVSGLRSQMNTAAGGIINKAKAKLLQSGSAATDAYNMEKALHDTLIGTFSYDVAASENPDGYPESFTSCGAFMNNTAVCEGYAKALKLLLDSQGIESLYVTGTATTSSGSGGHAWNMVKIDGKWYDLDATFDDPVYLNKDGSYNTGNTTPSYAYFNKTSFPDHTLGLFYASDPFETDSENYMVMPLNS